MSIAETAKKKTEKTAEFDIREIYTPLSVAKKEIQKRWKNKESHKKACPSTNF